MTRKFLFLDSNTFLHFRAFDELDWATLADAQQVTLVLAPVVLRELDKQKDQNRSKTLRSRASSAVAKLSRLLDEGPDAAVRPHVTLLLVPTDPSLDFKLHNLQPDVQDDRIVATVLEFQAEDPMRQVVVVTADLGLKAKAKHRGMQVFALPTDLRLPLELDEDQKEARELRAKLAGHESRLPKLRLAFAGATDRLEVVHRHVETSSDDEVKEEVDAHRKMVALTSRMGSAGWPPLSSAGEEKYQELLEKHFGRYADYVRARQSAKATRARTIRIEVQLCNEGTAPADDVDVVLLFPAGLKVATDDPDPAVPEQPAPPDRPSGGVFEMIELAHRARDLVPTSALVPKFNVTPLQRPNISQPSLNTVADGVEVHVNVQRAKQGQAHGLLTLYISFPDQDAVKSFQIGWRINAANLPTEVDDRLHVVVKNE